MVKWTVQEANDEVEVWLGVHLLTPTECFLLASNLMEVARRIKQKADDALKARKNPRISD